MIRFKKSIELISLKINICLIHKSSFQLKLSCVELCSYYFVKKFCYVRKKDRKNALNINKSLKFDSMIYRIFYFIK